MGRGGPTGRGAFAPWLAALPRLTPEAPARRRHKGAEIRSTSMSGLEQRALWSGLNCLPSEARQCGAPLAQRRPLRQATRSIFRSVLATAVPNASEERQHDKHDDEYE